MVFVGVFVYFLRFVFFDACLLTIDLSVSIVRAVISCKSVHCIVISFQLASISLPTDLSRMASERLGNSFASRCVATLWQGYINELLLFDRSHIR